MQGKDGYIGASITMMGLALLRADLFVCDAGTSVFQW